MVKTMKKVKVVQSTWTEMIWSWLHSLLLQFVLQFHFIQLPQVFLDVDSILSETILQFYTNLKYQFD